MIRDYAINYLEAPSQDLTATKDFFKTVFNWHFVDYGPDYTAFSTPEMEGGFFASGTPALTASGSALIVMYADNLEACADKVAAAGGDIIKPIFAFPGGRRFQFVAPGGSEFAVWSAN